MFTFTVKPDEGTEYKLVAGSRDVAIWERATKGRTLADLQRPSMCDFYGIAHVAAKRQGLTDLTKAQFEESCDLDMGDEDDEAEPDPTPPGA